MARSATGHAYHLVWHTTTVDGRTAEYGVGGTGRPMVFLHGWGLGHRAYKRGLRRLVEQGMRVYAPALPGFCGTAALPDDLFSMAGYARWVQQFLDAVGIDEPVLLAGHSFGGGVAIGTAAAAPDRVAQLIVINSIGASAWTDRNGLLRAMAERPMWDWGLHLPDDVRPVRQVTRVLPVLVQDLLPNAVRNPRALWRVGRLAATANLSEELEELKHRRVPVVILWGDGDRLIPQGAMQSLRTALGSADVHTVPGTHSWLLVDPAGFAEIMTNVVELPQLVDEAEPAGTEQSA